MWPSDSEGTAWLPHPIAVIAIRSSLAAFRVRFLTSIRGNPGVARLLDAAVDERGRERARYPDAAADRAGPARSAWPCPRCAARTTSTPSRPRRAVLPRQRGDRAQDPQRHPLERRGDGLARAARRVSASAATSPPSPPRPPLYDVGSTTSSGARTRATAVTRSSSRVTRRQASTRARTCWTGSASSTSTASGGRSPRRPTPCRRIRTRGRCRTSGSSRRSRWASARSARSTRRG